jgi:hypothetical protein
VRAVLDEMEAALRLEWWDADPVFSKAVLAGLAFAASAALGGLLVKSPCESREPGRARVPERRSLRGSDGLALT